METIYVLLKEENEFVFVYREKVKAKTKGDIDMCFVSRASV